MKPERAFALSCRCRMQLGIQCIHYLGPVAVILHRLAQEAGLRRRPKWRVMKCEIVWKWAMGFNKQTDLLGAAVESKLFKKRLE